jgi:hypothetical protein
MTLRREGILNSLFLVFILFLHKPKYHNTFFVGVFLLDCTLKDKCLESP